MQKNKQTWNVKTLVFLALLVAIQLVLSRVLVIDLGVYRITLGTIATVLAGLWMGPVAGGVEGAVADIIGCFMKGYGINPLITLSAIIWGVFAGFAGKLMAEKSRKVKTAIMCIAIVISGVVGTLGFTTAGLVMIGANFYAIMPGRLVQFAIMTPIYCVLTSLLYFSPLTSLVVENVRPTQLEKKTV
nr:folate family ECF transporter S component [uncultured Blautia sp.]